MPTKEFLEIRFPQSYIRGNFNLFVKIMLEWAPATQPEAVKQEGSASDIKHATTNPS